MKHASPLADAGIAHAELLDVGIMIETPAAVLKRATAGGGS